MRSNRYALLCGAALVLTAGMARGQAAEPAPSPAAAAKVGPATIAPHWSKYVYPDSVPEGAAYHLIEKGDTLWDLSGRYLGTPYLWPQIWEQNKYITDAHWIYPGDPLLLPALDVVASSAGQGGEGMDDDEDAVAPASEAPETVLYSISEEFTIFCAGALASSPEDQSFKILGSEETRLRMTFADRDIIYLNKGAAAGVRAGDVYSIHRPGSEVKHPSTRKHFGTRIDNIGRLRVILVHERSATAVIENACQEVQIGDYLKPNEPINVPLAVRRDPADRMTPPSGKADGYVVEIGLGGEAAATGNMVTIDMGSAAGIAPGNLLVAYRFTHPGDATQRYVLGDLAVVAVREKSATAKVVYSTDVIEAGDRVELR